MKDMEEIKRFTKSTERKIEELVMALLNISGKSNGSYNNNNENSPLLLEILKNHISNLEKELIEKDTITNFLLKQKNETNTNIRSVNKTVTENVERLETAGNSNPSSNSRQKRETQAEPLSKKKKIVLTGDSTVNGISEC